ncbi:hypothetical protein K501DRAFT_196255, partial [Backusella circina FSU 941]
KSSTTTTKTTATPAPTTGTSDCNPSYNVAGSTTCFTNCNVEAGKKYGVPNWTMDHTSPDFIASLTLMCDKSGSNYGSFMATAGMCMAGCAGDDPELFNTEWAGACAWYETHKNDQCTTGSGNATATTTAGGGLPTSTSAPSVVTVTKTKTCTKTKTVTKTKSASSCSTCTAGHYGLGRGKGYAGACCKDQSDCWESCIKGKCNGPSQSSCKPGYLRKRRGNGPKNACCETQRDCKESCIKGRCN